MSSRTASRDRLLDLLVAHVSEGTSPSERAEMIRLLSLHDDVDPAELERCAALLDQAFEADAPTLDLPSTLRERLLQDAAAWRLAVDVERRSPRRRVPLGWVAAAAGLVLSVGSLWWASQGAREPGLVARREILRSEGSATSWSWAGVDPAYRGVAGDVVWSTERQEGYLQFTGLPVNNPREARYQLWIVDEGRAHPVDGGLFDASPSQTLVPVVAKLPIRRATAFVVTLEVPEGVVVSDGPFLVQAVP